MRALQDDQIQHVTLQPVPLQRNLGVTGQSREVFLIEGSAGSRNRGYRHRIMRFRDESFLRLMPEAIVVSVHRPPSEDILVGAPLMEGSVLIVDGKRYRVEGHAQYLEDPRLVPMAPHNGAITLRNAASVLLANCDPDDRLGPAVDFLLETATMLEGRRRPAGTTTQSDDD